MAVLRARSVTQPAIGVAFATVAAGWEVVRIVRRRGLVGYKRYQSPPERNVTHRFEDPQWEIRGGLRAGGSNASVPLATLNLDRRWCRISALGYFMPVVWLAREEVLQVRRVGWFFSPGLMFDTADKAFAGVIFWTFQPTRVLDMFAEAGWPVAPA